MSRKNDKAFALFERRVKYWSDRILSDDKITIKVQYVKECDMTADDAYGVGSETEKKEELLVSALTRALVDKKDHDLYVKFDFLDNDDKVSRPMASMDGEFGQYRLYTVNMYQRMEKATGDTLFAVANCVACHEVLHIAVWDAMSFSHMLEKDD